MSRRKSSNPTKSPTESAPNRVIPTPQSQKLLLKHLLSLNSSSELRNTRFQNGGVTKKRALPVVQLLIVQDDNYGRGKRHSRQASPNTPKEDVTIGQVNGAGSRKKISSPVLPRRTNVMVTRASSHPIPESLLSPPPIIITTNNQVVPSPSPLARSFSFGSKTKDDSEPIRVPALETESITQS